eukprot:CFRG1633T1
MSTCTKVEFSCETCPYETLRCTFGKGCVEEDRQTCPKNHLSVVEINDLPGHSAGLRLDMCPGDGDGNKIGSTERQRTEFKGYGKSQDGALKAIEGDTVMYTWWFKIAPNVCGGGKFYHCFQIKAVGNGVEGGPLLTFGIRKNTFRLESNRRLFKDVDLWPLEHMWGRWIHISVTVHYHSSCGNFKVAIHDADGKILYEDCFENLCTWNESGVYDFVRPKWGLYRNNTGYTNSHTVYFTDLNITRIEGTTAISTGVANESNSEQGKSKHSLRGTIERLRHHQMR